jgi:hypothetical protein
MQELNAWLELQKNKKAVAKTRQLSVKREHSAELVGTYIGVIYRLCIYVSARTRDSQMWHLLDVAAAGFVCVDRGAAAGG